jgi:SAM-dependent methyltransferase
MSRHSESIEQVTRYYDALGAAEWERLEGDVRGRVSLEVHRRFLRRFVRPGMRVLEIGAGPGRFTLELAQVGTSIVVTDISEVQLALNAERLHGTDAERCVQRRELLVPSGRRPPAGRECEQLGLARGRRGTRGSRSRSGPVGAVSRARGRGLF